MFLAGVHADQGAAAHRAALRAARQLPGVREAVSGDRAVAAVLRRRDVSASDWKDGGQVSWLGSAGITLYRAHGRNGSDRVVEVTDESGCRSAAPSTSASRGCRNEAGGKSCADEGKDSHLCTPCAEPLSLPLGRMTGKFTPVRSSETRTRWPCC